MKKLIIFIYIIFFSISIFTLSFDNIELKIQYIPSTNNNLAINFMFIDPNTGNQTSISLIRIYANEYNPKALIYELIPKKKNTINVSTLEKIENFNFLKGQTTTNNHLILKKNKKYVFKFVSSNEKRPGSILWFHFPFYATEEASWLFDDNGYYRDLFAIRYEKGFLWCKDKLIIYINNKQNIPLLNSVILKSIDGTIINAEPSIHKSELHFTLGRRFKKRDSIYVIFPKDSFGINKQSDNLKYLFDVP